MPTENCSKILYNAINKSYLQQNTDNFSYAKAHRKKDVPEYVPKDGTYIKTYPPLGEMVRHSVTSIRMLPLLNSILGESATMIDTHMRFRV